MCEPDWFIQLYLLSLLASIQETTWSRTLFTVSPSYHIGENLESMTVHLHELQAIAGMTANTDSK